ncbi:MAG: SpoIIE family protein phosphatase, partial [Anaerolineae bacterium]|nr:SpoIIE family protein phosphatase [Anaerolineae bacterium]
SILDIDDLLDEVVDLVTDNLGYDRVHLFLRVGERLVFRSGSGVHSGRWVLERLAYALDADGFIPRVARTGQAMLTGSVDDDEWYVTGSGVEDTQSEMAVPIRIGGHVLGVFDIQSTAPDAFTEDDVALIQALADTVAIAVRNATLFANEQRRRIVSETLRELSTALGSSLDLNSVLDGILIGLERVVDYTAGLILLRDGDSRENSSGEYGVNSARGDIAGPESELWNETIPANLVSSTTLFDLLHSLNANPAQLTDHAHDEMMVALMVAGQPIGYLVLERTGPDTFTPEDREIINTFANQAAIAITNAQLYMAQREEAWVSTALLRVAEATARATSLDDVLRTVARITPLLVGVEWSAVILADDPNTFRVVEIAGPGPDITAALTGFTLSPLSWPLLAELKQNRQPILINADSPRPADMPVAVTIGQGVVLPLMAKGEVTGLILIGQGDHSAPMSERKIELVSGIANQAALAIERAQLIAAQQEEAWVTTALLQVAEAVNTQIDADQSLETIVRLTPLLVGITCCGVMKWHADAGNFTGGPSWGLTPENRKLFAELNYAPADGPFLDKLSGDPDPISCGVGADHPLPPILQRVFESPTLLGLPLVARGHLVGAMLVDHPALGGTIDQRRLNILSGIAHQTALALENARLQAEASAAERLGRELEVAHDIQTSFLPRSFPTVPGWDIAAYYRAAQQVGGDFYDVFQVDEHHYALVVADVADKGVPAALFMALSRTLLRAVGSNRQAPAQTLLRVNELLLRDTHSDLFVTVWYGLWNIQTGEITFSSAGHNPPLVVRADSSGELLTARGIALGVVPEITLQQHTITLVAGDALIAYTDGVTEAFRSDHTEFGVMGIQSAAAQLRRRSAHDLANGIASAVDNFVAGAPQFDDMTLIVLKHLAG